MPKINLSDLLNVATDAAREAGHHTLKYFNNSVAVETKSDDTPVTIADREAEQMIRRIVGERYPSHRVLGEEFGETTGDAEVTWIIDPIDGTKSFIHGVPLYGVMIGIEVAGEPSVGVVYHPPTNEMIAAANGMGCTWNDRPARVSEVSELKDATLLVGSFTRAMKRSDAYWELANQVKLSRGWGDCYAYSLVATGRAEVMLDPRMSLWDCAPLLPILREAGGYFGDWKGRETIRAPEGCATNAKLKDAVIAALGKHPTRTV